MFLIPLLGIPVDAVPGHRGPDHSLRKHAGNVLDEESFSLCWVHEDVINYITNRANTLSVSRDLEHSVLLAAHLECKRASDHLH